MHRYRTLFKTCLAGIAACLALMLPAIAAPQSQSLVVGTVADLQQASPVSATSIQVLGYNVAGDEGGGLFIWNPRASEAPDHCVSFAGQAAGRWIRQMNGRDLQVEDCGAYNDASNGAATRQAFQRAADYVLKSSNPTGTIGFKGGEYLFDGITVQISGKYNCPNFVGGGAGTIVRFSPQMAGTPAFRFTAASGSRCGGGIRNFSLFGNGNAVGVRLDGVTGATIHFGLGPNVTTGVVLCNCAPGQFSEMNDIKVDSDALGIGQQTIVTQVAGGNDSFAGNSLAGYVSLASGTRTKPIISIGQGSYWYNGRWDMNVHNIGGGGAATILSNNSSNCIKASTGTLQLETTNAAALTVVSGCMYYGGTVYALGANSCVGVKYSPGFVLTKTSSIGPSGVQEVAGADQYCLTQTFAGGSGVALTRVQIAQFTTTYAVTVRNSENSYNQSAVFTVTWDTSATGACVISLQPGWSPTIDVHRWGTPILSCANGRPQISNPRWPSGGPAGQFIASFDVHAQ